MAAPLDASRFRELVEALPDPLLVVDSAGAIVFANGRAEDAFGYARGELEGQPVEVLVPDRFAHGHAALRERFAAAAVARPMGGGRELVARRKNGTEFPVEVALSPLRAGGGRPLSVRHRPRRLGSPPVRAAAGRPRGADGRARRQRALPRLRQGRAGALRHLQPGLRGGLPDHARAHGREDGARPRVHPRGGAPELPRGGRRGHPHGRPPPPRASDRLQGRAGPHDALLGGRLPARRRQPRRPDRPARRHLRAKARAGAARRGGGAQPAAARVDGRGDLRRRPRGAHHVRQPGGRGDAGLRARGARRPGSARGGPLAARGRQPLPGGRVPDGAGARAGRALPRGRRAPVAEGRHGPPGRVPGDAHAQGRRGGRRGRQLHRHHRAQGAGRRVPRGVEHAGRGDGAVRRERLRRRQRVLAAHDGVRQHLRDRREDALRVVAGAPAGWARVPRGRRGVRPPGDRRRHGRASSTCTRPARAGRCRSTSRSPRRRSTAGPPSSRSRATSRSATRHRPS